MRTSVPFLWVCVGLLALGLASLFYMHFSQPSLRIAYVNSTRLLDDYQGMIEARRTYAKQQQEWQRNTDTLRHELQRGIASYRRERSQLSASQQQARELELRGKQQQLAEYQRAVQEQDVTIKQTMTQPLVDSANVFVQRYGKAHDYDMVLLTAGGDNVAYAKDKLDVTVPVLQELNAQYQKASRVK